MSEKYEKIYIKSENDLPKGIDGYYIVKPKSGMQVTEEYYHGDNKDQDKVWVLIFDWYLRSI